MTRQRAAGREFPWGFKDQLQIVCPKCCGWLVIDRGFRTFEKRVQGMIDTFSRKPAARLGEVFFANKVSLGGLGAERS